VERPEELVFDARNDRAQLDELPAPGRREADHVPAAVVRIAPALDEPAVLERVEDADELAAIEPEHVGNRRLGLARALVEQREQAVVVRLVARALELGERPRLHHEPELRKQESRALEQLVRDPEAGAELGVW